MSRKEARPKRVFSLRYLATQELDVSLSSATAVATFGSFLSKVMVVLTLLITSSVSFTYSSSEAANAEETGDKDRVRADRERKSRRLGRSETADAVVEVAVATVTFDLTGMKGFEVVVVVVGVISVGEAIGWVGEWMCGEKECCSFCEGSEKYDLVYCHVGLSSYLVFVVYG